MSRKVLFIAFVALLALVCAVSCKLDMTRRTLIGTWYGKLSYSVLTEEYTLTVTDDRNFRLEEVATMFGSKDPDPVVINGTYEFTSDTEGTLTADDEIDVIYTLGGSEKTKTIPFTLAGDKLTITDPEEYLSVILTRQPDK